jgi:MFS family permease
MTTTAVGGSTGRGGTVRRVLFDRYLDTYPSTARRIFCLAVVLVTAVVLYYEQYVSSGVAPLIVEHFHMSFRYYVDLSVFAALAGAIFSLAAGAGDRIGRANMFVYGVLVIGLLELLAAPNAPSKAWFSVVIIAVGVVEGIVLVATLTLARDFSAQTERGSASGLWSIGVAGGALIASEVTEHTLSHLHTWQSQYVIAGTVGTVLGVVAVLTMRELKPELRSQVMVSMRDRLLVELRARGLDLDEALAHPWRQMLRLPLLLPGIAVSLYVIGFLTISSYFTLYVASVYKLSTVDGNGLLVWFYASNIVTYFVVGPISDRLHVRKPLMLIGAAGTIAATALLLVRADQPTGYYTLVWIVSLFGISLSFGYAPWLAAYSETVEARNPALVATGMALWGWVVRLITAISLFVLPYVVGSVSTILDNEKYGADVPKVEAIVHRYGPLLAIAQKHQALLAQLGKYPANKIPPALLSQAIHQVGLANLVALSKIKAQLAFIQRVSPHLLALQHASAVGGHEWQTWWWVAIAGCVVFVPVIFTMSGHWSPRKAREELERHEAMVAAELARLGSEPQVAGSERRDEGTAGGAAAALT